MTSEPEIVPLVTAVLWAMSLTVGVLGLCCGYPSGQVTPAASTVQTRILAVQIQKESLPQPVIPKEAPKIGASQPLSIAVPLPPAVERVSIPAAPPTVVASPIPMIVFPVPTEGLIKVVEAQDADYRAVSGKTNKTSSSQTSATGAAAERTPVAAPVPEVTHLTFGEGEGNQPAPEYPRAAQLAGEEGSVDLRFTVDAEGKVTFLNTVKPSRWPLLNIAATRAVRAHWRFPSGTVRTYDVTIQFQLQQ